MKKNLLSLIIKSIILSVLILSFTITTFGAPLNLAASTTTLGYIAAASIGDTYSIEVSVSGASGTPTGSVTVDDGEGHQCQITLVSGAGSCSLIAYSAGDKTITANYSGDGVYDPSSDSTTHTITKIASYTNIDYADAAEVGTPYTVEVSVSGASGTPTGTVDVNDGEGNTCTITLSAGSGTCDLTSTTAGNKILVADYNGSETHQTSSDSTLHTVEKGTTYTSIDYVESVPFGSPYQVDVSVSANSGTPTGSVDIDDGEGNTCTATLTSGSGSCSLTSTTAGTKTITAAYSGDSNYAASSTNTSHNVEKLPSYTTIDWIDPASVGDSYTVEVSVGADGGTPTGSVNVSDGEGGSCSAALTAGSGSCALTTSTPGEKTITAAYQGDTTYAISSTNRFHNVEKAPTYTYFDYVAPSTVGDTFLVEVSVYDSGTTPTGTVIVLDNKGQTCTITLSGGSGSCTMPHVSGGKQRLMATYQGNSYYFPSNAIKDYAPTYSVLFFTPAILSPINYPTYYTNPTLKWLPVDQATTYQVRIFDKYNAIVYERYHDAATVCSSYCKVTPTQNFWNGNYTWIVYGKSDVWGPKSSVGSFHMAGDYGPYLTNPINNAPINFPRVTIKVDGSTATTPIKQVAFYAGYDDGSGRKFHFLGTDTDGSDGWNYVWTSGVAYGQTAAVRVLITNTNNVVTAISAIADGFTITTTLENGYNTRTEGKTEQQGEQADTQVLDTPSIEFDTEAFLVILEKLFKQLSSPTITQVQGKRILLQ